MEIPVGPYVGLFGSHTGDWRHEAIRQLVASGISYFDPTDRAWRNITDVNGDNWQAEIDALVHKQHVAMIGSACVVFHLARRIRVGGVISQTEVKPAFAARCELGFLTGRGVRTFVHIEGDVEGRNYLWAQIAPYTYMTRCGDLDKAVRRAVRFIKALQNDAAS